ncbi:DEKNAAC103712 [Brettanomyces naardenensis]|uniref:DEKNAAC103712 n=1 Tax=Brettanomyces naardenensis TaxID=13370 RepID=A0A448YNY6_BRENA|nr:DEKNAAC103712 [Brettanomyces naardenensis]
MLVIGRSKLAWDFAVTVHVINLFCAWMYEGFPKNLSWWALQVMSSLIMVSLGTYTTRWKELRDTFFDGLIDAELGQSNAMMGDTDQNENEESEGVRNTIPMKNMTKV